MTVKTVDDYLDALAEPARSSLAALRRAIRAAAPMASETIGMGVPSYRHHGVLVSFSAAKTHCAFYVMSELAMTDHARELQPYDTAKTAIRFPHDRPLPDDLVARLVQTRIRENEAGRAR